MDVPPGALIVVVSAAPRRGAFSGKVGTGFPQKMRPDQNLPDYIGAARMPKGRIAPRRRRGVSCGGAVH
jgi:hypothetical protein